ncbi:hypothetical protein BKA67DRAFT_677688 [Truncatella angustata]|uniref:Carbohydrate esterase family 16 protein n=1 Tax=Truncatella angustata TaxID=152316 RepID=A0A9P8UIA9_9PEZI|nr:uncharacterized protein BKA67DRAFT_677688 [Truncatella angustata]KAH6652619.1 hypothetical protein BKA67DRAFT_677688 [Truncatella angustata]
MSTSFTTTALVLGILNLSGISEAQSFNWANTKSVVSFGDSYSYILGTAGSPNPLHEGFLAQLHKLLHQIVLNGVIGTAEGGPNWLEFLTGCATSNGQYSPANCPRKLWDFAFSGASVSEQFLPRHLSVTIPLVNQTQQYLNYADAILTNTPVNLSRSSTLVAIWIGINDIFDSKTYKPSGRSDASFWGAELDVVFNTCAKSLYARGFRNFLFMNLPPIDRTPANQRSSTPYPTKSQVNLWDSLLASKANTFQSANAGSKAMVYDANTFLNNVMSNPSAYGITNTATYCSGWQQQDVLTNPGKYGCVPQSRYFWYNAAHL